MPNITEKETDPVREEGYRRGYIHGAQAIIDVLGGFMDEHRLTKLRWWAANELRPWQVGQSDDFRPPSVPDLSDRFQNQVED